MLLNNPPKEVDKMKVNRKRPIVIGFRTSEDEKKQLDDLCRVKGAGRQEILLKLIKEAHKNLK